MVMGLGWITGASIYLYAWQTPKTGGSFGHYPSTLGNRLREEGFNKKGAALGVRS
jgi:hypothetical protein